MNCFSNGAIDDLAPAAICWPNPGAIVSPPGVKHRCVRARAASLTLWAALFAALWARGATAEPGVSSPAPAAPEQVAEPAPEPQIAFPGLDPNSLGALSIGHPHQGYLLNGVRMPQGKYWTVALPDYAYGTEETIAGLIRCITLVNQRIANTPKVVIGSISKENGGHFAPHKSHQSGRDADVGFYYNPGFQTERPATRENLDVERTWALVRTFIIETDVDMILIDTKVQRLLEVHALRRGEDPLWLKNVFHGDGRPYTALILHAPGHTAHMHVRFTSPIARQRGKSSYATLVEQGHIKLRRKEIRHRVERGDTLTGIAKKYGVSAETLLKLNQLSSPKIRVGQALVIQQPEHLRGALDPIVVPKRRLPDDVAHTTRSANLTASSPSSVESATLPGALPEREASGPE